MGNRNRLIPRGHNRFPGSQAGKGTGTQHTSPKAVESTPIHGALNPVWDVRERSQNTP